MRQIRILRLRGDRRDDGHGDVAVGVLLSADSLKGHKMDSKQKADAIIQGLSMLIVFACCCCAVIWLIVLPMTGFLYLCGFLK